MNEVKLRGIRVRQDGRGLGRARDLASGPCGIRRSYQDHEMISANSVTRTILRYVCSVNTYKNKDVLVTMQGDGTAGFNQPTLL